MKKIIAVLCVAMLLIATSVPALADQGKNPGGEPAGMNMEHGNDRNALGKNNKQNPPANHEGDSSQPENGHGADKNEQTDGFSANAPDGKDSPQPNNGPKGSFGNEPSPDKDGRQNPIQKLVDDGKLSQSTYEAVQNYLKEHRSSDSGASEIPPEKPESGSSSDDSEKNPSAKPEDGPAKGNSGNDDSLPSKEMLDAMLNESVITEEEYNLLLEAIEKPASSADGAETESSQETSTEETTV